MLKLDLFQQLLIVSAALSTVTCSIIQKTKGLFSSSNYLSLYSFLLNLVSSVLFCNTFTTISFPISLWVGLFSFLGADTIYKSLEGKISSYSNIRTKKVKNIDKTSSESNEDLPEINIEGDM